MVDLTAKRRKELEKIYRDVRYDVFLPDKTMTIRVGEVHPVLDDFLSGENAPGWVFITACNPAAGHDSDEINDERMEKLRKKLLDRGFYFFGGAGRGTENHPDEPSFWVLGMSEDEGLKCAEEFGQAAIVAGEKGKRAKLLFTF